LFCFRNMDREIVPNPLFILSPPRSYSSLVCAMIGQHPDMYGFPELNLFLTDTVGELLDQPTSAGYVEGLVRAVEELVIGEATPDVEARAKKWVATQRDMKSSDMFQLLLHEIRPLAGVVKSPRTALSMGSLSRAVRFFPRARFLHLTRHPVSSVASLLAVHRSYTRQVGDDDATYNFYAQLWITAHRSILAITRELDPETTVRVKAEDIGIGVDCWLERIARWLGVSHDAPCIEAMKHPERSPYAAARPHGSAGENDIGFLAAPWFRPVPEPPALDFSGPLDFALRREAVDLAKALGY
jgi:Sulfotransferase family